MAAYVDESNVAAAMCNENRRRNEGVKAKLAKNQGNGERAKQSIGAYVASRNSSIKHKTAAVWRKIKYRQRRSDK